MENSEKKKYFPYPSDRPSKKFYIITNDNKKKSIFWPNWL
jgi:uncharacterized protein YbdZ (MbtH family)